MGSDEEMLAGLEESWIVTQDVALKSIVKPSLGKNNGYGRRHRQPKGTKPRRWKGSSKNNSGGIKPVQTSMEDNESTSSSIAIVPSPEPLTRPAASPVTASTVLAASSDAKQMATIASARVVRFQWEIFLAINEIKKSTFTQFQAKQKADKSWMSRKNLLRSNQTMMAAAGRNNRRSQLIGSRLCGSNNNRKSHQF